MIEQGRRFEALMLIEDHLQEINRINFFWRVNFLSIERIYYYYQDYDFYIQHFCYRNCAENTAVDFVNYRICRACLNLLALLQFTADLILSTHYNLAFS